MPGQILLTYGDFSLCALTVDGRMEGLQDQDLYKKVKGIGRVKIQESGIISPFQSNAEESKVLYRRPSRDLYPCKIL